MPQHQQHLALNLHVQYNVEHRHRYMHGLHKCGCAQGCKHAKMPRSASIMPTLHNHMPGHVQEAHTDSSRLFTASRSHTAAGGNAFAAAPSSLSSGCACAAECPACATVASRRRDASGHADPAPGVDISDGAGLGAAGSMLGAVKMQASCTALWAAAARGARSCLLLGLVATACASSSAAPSALQISSVSPHTRSSNRSALYNICGEWTENSRARHHSQIAPDDRPWPQSKSAATNSFAQACLQAVAHLCK